MFHAPPHEPLPGAFSLATFEPLLDHEDLKPQTINPDLVEYVGHAFENFARAALARGSILEYQRWRERTQHFAASLNENETEAAASMGITLTRLCLFGYFEAGDETALTMLHDLLSEEQKRTPNAPAGVRNGTRLHNVAEIYGAHAIAPIGLINTYARPGNERADAWITYVRAHHEIQTHPTLLEDIKQNTGPYVSNFLHGPVSERAILEHADYALIFAEPNEKHAVITKLYDAMTQPHTRVNHTSLPLDGFAEGLLEITYNPDIAVRIKKQLIDLFIGLSANDRGLAKMRHCMDLAVMAIEGNPILDTLLQIEAHTADQPIQKTAVSDRDNLLHVATRAYSSIRRFDEAATMAIRIVGSAHWVAAVDEYQTQGGAMRLLQELEADYQAAAQSSKLESYTLIPWAERAHYIDFLQALTTKDYDVAEQSLFAMIQATFTANHSNGIPRRILTGCLQRLLHTHPSSIDACTKLLPLLTPDKINDENLRMILYTLVAHGLPGTLEISHRLAKFENNKPAARLGRFALSALAAAGVVGTDRAHY
jgi:hypothetical protein